MSAALSIYREGMHILITLTNAVPKAPRGLGWRSIRDLLNTFHLQLRVFASCRICRWCLECQRAGAVTLNDLYEVGACAGHDNFKFMRTADKGVDNNAVPT